MATQFTLEEAFSVPPEQVFRAVSEVEHYGDWMPNFVGVEKLTEGEFGVGTRFKETRKFMGRKATELFEVTGCEPGKAIELFVDGTKGTSRRGEYRFRYSFAPEGERGTRMILKGEVGGMGKIASLLGFLLAGAFKKAMARDHAALKRYVEKPPNTARGTAAS